MPPSSPPPDRFPREIEDVIRLAERRLKQQSPRERTKRRLRSLRGSLGNLSPTLRSLPPAEVLAGWALALLLLSWLVGLLVSVIRLPFGSLFALSMQVLGIVLLVTALILSLTRNQRGREKQWRGERISYGSPYGEPGIVTRVKRFFSGRR